MSTALGDPIWYHENGDKSSIYIDKRGIINGLRLLPIINAAKLTCASACPLCEDKNPDTCLWKNEYREALETIDFDSMMKGIKQFVDDYCKKHKIIEEPIAVLMVHESPTNACSERYPLIDYFCSHGVDCKELDYPIE